jgi:type VI secretion system protein ImpH
MESDQQPDPGSLGALLRQSPQRFELLQALMILEREPPNAASLATTNDPDQDVVRLRGPLLPEFSPSEISSLRYVSNPHKPKAPRKLTLHTQVFGLGGPDGPLPYAYQEWLQQRARLKDLGTVAFLDLFQHRLLSLLYRVQLRHRIALPFRAPEQSPVYQQLRALCGLLPTPAQGSTQLPEHALIARAGLLANGRRSLAGFQNLIAHHFKVPVQLRGYQGGWRRIAQSDQSVLGRQGRNLGLGRNALCGSRVWDEHAGIHISIGLLPNKVAETFMPGQPPHEQLAALVAFYFGGELDCTLSLHFEQSEPLQLGLPRQPALGLGTRLNRETQTGDFRVDLRLQGEGAT